MPTSKRHYGGRIEGVRHNFMLHNMSAQLTAKELAPHVKGIRTPLELQRAHCRLNLCDCITRENKRVITYDGAMAEKILRDQDLWVE